MTVHVIWALVAAIWALALWDMVRRYAFATATRNLKAEIEGLRLENAELREELGNAKLPERVKKLETLTIALKTHVETQRVTRPNPFARKQA